MIRLIIIPTDTFVSVDDVGYFDIDMSSVDSNIHAVQWFGNKGWIEYKEIDGVKPNNQDITNIDQFETVINEWKIADYNAKNPPPPTPEEIRKKLISDVGLSLEKFAAEKGYDSIISLTSYINSTVEQFRLEAQKGILLRDQTWQKFYEILDEVDEGIRPLPNSYEEIKSELPPLIW